MADTLEVHCVRPYDIDDEEFLDPADQFRNALYLPQPAFEYLDVPHYGYVRIASRSSRDTTAEMRVVAAPLSPSVSMDASEHGPPQCRGALRTNLFTKLSPDGSYAGEVLRVRADESIASVSGTTYRSYDDEVAYRVCHLSPVLMETLSVAQGAEVEVFDPRTGGRIDVEVGDPHHGDEETVRIDVRSRQALAIETGDPVGVRSFAFDASERGGLSRRCMRWLIDSREMPFNVQLGPDQDEYRNIVRMSEDMMSFLGIEAGDNVVLNWRGTRTKSQCLPMQGDPDPPNEIEIASTERDVIDVSVHDAVTVERDMWYVFKEQIALSIFGIIGVVVGVVQIIPLVGRTTLTNLFGNAGSVVATTGVILLFSAVVVWLLLIPERQKCVSRDRG